MSDPQDSECDSLDGNSSADLYGKNKEKTAVQGALAVFPPTSFLFLCGEMFFGSAENIVTSEIAWKKSIPLKRDQ